MQGDVVGILVGVLQNRGFPAPKSGHIAPGAAAGHQLDGGIHPFHQLGGFPGSAPVFLGRFGTHLPRTVHFVAQTPGVNAEWCGKPILDSQIAVFAAARMVAVLHQILGLAGAPGAQVHRHHHLGAGPARPLLELIDSNLVGFNGSPGKLCPAGTQLLGADAVLPAVSGDKISPGIPYNGNSQLADQIQDIPAKAHLVSRRMPGLIDSSVDCPSKMLQKGAENPRIHLGDGILFYECKRCLFHG